MAKKNINSTVITVGAVAILGYIAYKYFSHHRFGGGGSSGGGGPVGGIQGGYPYYPQYGQQQPQGGPSINFGQGNPFKNWGNPSSGSGTQTIAQALFGGQYDAATENALATIYNAQTNFSTTNDAPIDYGAYGNLPELSNPTVSEQPTDTSSIFQPFTDWFNSWAGNPVDQNTGPSGSDISAQTLSDYSNFEGDTSSAYDGSGSFDSSSYDPFAYGGDSYGGDFSYDGGGDSGAGSVGDYGSSYDSSSAGTDTGGDGGGDTGGDSGY